MSLLKNPKLSSSSVSSSDEGVIKINCKPLDQTELKKFDKNEKGLVINLTTVTKGEYR